jgi:hypothetical protein
MSRGLRGTRHENARRAGAELALCFGALPQIHGKENERPRLEIVLGPPIGGVGAFGSVSYYPAVHFFSDCSYARVIAPVP